MLNTSLAYIQLQTHEVLYSERHNRTNATLSHSTSLPWPHLPSASFNHRNHFIRHICRKINMDQRNTRNPPPPPPPTYHPHSLHNRHPTPPCTKAHTVQVALVKVLSESWPTGAAVDFLLSVIGTHLGAGAKHITWDDLWNTVTRTCTGVSFASWHLGGGGCRGCQDMPLMRGHSGTPDERPPWWETTLMRDHPGERPPWWETTLVREHPNERQSWWESTLMRDHPMRDHPDERAPWWESTLVREHPDERPPWWETTRWETTLMREHPDERAPWWESTLMREHPDERAPWWAA